MKKLILSGGLSLLFFLYGLHQQQEDRASQIIAPNIATLPRATTTPTTTSTPVVLGAPSSTAMQSTITTTTPTPIVITSPTPTPTIMGKYKDGTYTGSVADASWGNIQVAAKVTGGKLTQVTFLQYPNDRQTSIRINQQAMPYLQQEAIQAQSAQVDGVSGASDTSQAFIESLTSALKQAS